MRFTVQYIPLDQIQPGGPVPLTERIKKLKSYLWDCMHLIAVRRNRKDGSYTILSGHERYLFLRDHTKKQYAPCIVDETKALSELEALLAHMLRGKERILEQPNPLKLRLLPTSWVILRMFLRQEPRFSRLSRRQQMKVILLAIRNKRTVVKAMRAKVDEMLIK
ncbi:hypothetical protein [Paenibacillus cremeus]|uniref:ParB/Sulfiredoxin domain-containing protein n=1 Tax=Paenibacillus cremeus TaxID=2163881 RepID=A0A559KG12_9BACL|nr:hypothetical protein [Paenibacillus cremeus]TVY11038.1 hypothetical protein FPZ49_06090 [Paenibacillus cremeus]